MSRRLNCAAERLASSMSSYPASCHFLNWVHASRSVHSPIWLIIPVRSATGMNSAGEIHPLLGMEPTDQSLGADRQPGLDRDLGLIEDHQLIVFERVAQLLLDETSGA